jgi:hypothetical protein
VVEDDGLDTDLSGLQVLEGVGWTERWQAIRSASLTRARYFGLPGLILRENDLDADRRLDLVLDPVKRLAGWSVALVVLGCLGLVLAVLASALLEPVMARSSSSLAWLLPYLPGGCLLLVAAYLDYRMKRRLRSLADRHLPHGDPLLEAARGRLRLFTSREAGQLTEHLDEREHRYSR